MVSRRVPRGPGPRGLRGRPGAVRRRRVRRIPAATTSGSYACIYTAAPRLCAPPPRLCASPLCLLAAPDPALHLSAAGPVTTAGGIGQGPVLRLGRAADRLRPG